MKNKKPNATQIWKHFEDFLVPRLRLSITDRAVYSHLVRHSRLEGRPRLRFSIAWLARGARLSGGPARESVRRLVAKGALRLVERSRAGHMVEVRLPEEIRATRPASIAASRQALLSPAASLEETDFLKSKALRQAIHSREGGLCFYCLRRITARMQCLDHVLPRVRSGRNSYRNLVSSCVECNSQKGERPADDFLRWLYRQRRLTAVELDARLRALDALAAGKLRPTIAPISNPLGRMGRPPLHPASP
jgi:5-methylcytosine-specific restriction endonuclease McrA